MIYKDDNLATKLAWKAAREITIPYILFYALNKYIVKPKTK